MGVKVELPAVVSPGYAAERLGIPVSGLVAIIRRHKYFFTELAPGGKPGDRGRNRWGLTGDQLAAILRGQERGFREPEPPKTEPNKSPFSTDGKSRLRPVVKRGGKGARS